MTNQELRSCLEAAGVLPVITAIDVESTVLLCKALAAGGLTAVEITLRSDCALEAIAEVKQQCHNLVVSAGTITSTKDIEAVAKLGIDFCLSPGMTTTLIECAQANAMPFVPGVATPSEVMVGMEAGLSCFKLFPASVVGGMAMLKALAGPLPQVGFCPTGGVSEANMAEFLALSNVMCVGGTWLADTQLVSANKWAQIQQLAAGAVTQAAKAA